MLRMYIIPFILFCIYFNLIVDSNSWGHTMWHVYTLLLFKVLIFTLDVETLMLKSPFSLNQ